MDTFDDLTGKFLVATSKMTDSRFAEQLILICTYNPNDGAMGVVVNSLHGKLSLDEILFADVSRENVLLPDVYIGGPVGMDTGFVLYEIEKREKMSLAETGLIVTPEIALSRERRMLEDIIHGRGPQHYLFMVGYAGWGAGQLELELTRDGWLVVPGLADILFRTPPEKRWQAASAQYGIDITIFGDEIGNA